MRLYLASTSPARLALLRQIGIEPIVVPSSVDEEAAVRAKEETSGTLSGPSLVQLLARLKAEAVVDALPDGAPIDGFILGGDSAFEFDRVIYGKPHLPAVARERWLRQRGRAGVLHSGHWLIDHRLGAGSSPAGSGALAEAGAEASAGAGAGAGVGAGAVTSATVEFAADITEAEIDAYIATGEPLEVAGAFTVDGLAAPFIRSVSGAPSTVIGMSLPTIRDLLNGFGVSLTEFWTPTTPVHL
ncbi:Maf family protein [Subtercola boreus]|uniref:Nucleoside triphosphate pyrophosphatase n=1 Tax=Subtercola boreus TaxID=120213 RepID=A0A3E0WFD6_9MICO|nr:Maf family protein [Subtercola boreus]RFA22837.1 septum formation inhibitor Maf [Subtercola boreus]RFA23187.1 septum formation inhibitor Maf [Subtercola boreus]RFA28939.1 septum formation inhibitor Maf [Subtercola boreus]